MHHTSIMGGGGQFSGGGGRSFPRGAVFSEVQFSRGGAVFLGGQFSEGGGQISEGSFPGGCSFPGGGAVFLEPHITKTCLFKYIENFTTKK